MTDSSFGMPVVDTYLKKKKSYNIGKDGPYGFGLPHSPPEGKFY